MYLFIDTTEENKITVAVFDKIGEIVKKRTVISDSRGGNRLLPMIDWVLNSLGLAAKKLGGILVVSGPGAFSSVRTGVVTANTMSLALKIPIAGAEKKEAESAESLIAKGAAALKGAKPGVVKPVYAAEPNISKPKELKGRRL